MSDNLQELYDLYLDIADGMVEKYGAMEVAAVMMAISLSIYKSGLDEIDYNAMVDNISASRTQVKKLHQRYCNEENILHLATSRRWLFRPFPSNGSR
jgi:hypothetical protein